MARWTFWKMWMSKLKKVTSLYWWGRLVAANPHCSIASQGLSPSLQARFQSMARIWPLFHQRTVILPWCFNPMRFIPPCRFPITSLLAWRSGALIKPNAKKIGTSGQTTSNRNIAFTQARAIIWRPETACGHGSCTGSGSKIVFIWWTTFKSWCKIASWNADWN